MNAKIPPSGMPAAGIPPVDPTDVKDVVGMIGAAVDDMLNKDVSPRRWGFFFTVVETGKDNPTMELFYNVDNGAVIMMLKEIVGRLEGRVHETPGKA